MSARDAVIVDAVRTPVGKRNGSLAGVHAADLSAHVLNALVARNGFDPAVVADPYPAFARAREVAPVQWHEGLQLWLAFTHAESNAVLRDRPPAEYKGVAKFFAYLSRPEIQSARLLLRQVS